MSTRTTKVKTIQELKGKCLRKRDKVNDILDTLYRIEVILDDNTSPEVREAQLVNVRSKFAALRVIDDVWESALFGRRRVCVALNPAGSSEGLFYRAWDHGDDMPDYEELSPSDLRDMTINPNRTDSTKHKLRDYLAAIEMLPSLYNCALKSVPAQLDFSSLITLEPVS